MNRGLGAAGYLFLARRVMVRRELCTRSLIHWVRLAGEGVLYKVGDQRIVTTDLGRAESDRVWLKSLGA